MRGLRAVIGQCCIRQCCLAADCRLMGADRPRAVPLPLQVGRGGKLGDRDGGVAFSEMTVEDLLEVRGGEGAGPGARLSGAAGWCWMVRKLWREVLMPRPGQALVACPGRWHKQHFGLASFWRLLAASRMLACAAVAETACRRLTTHPPAPRPPVCAPAGCAPSAPRGICGQGCGPGPVLLRQWCTGCAAEGAEQERARAARTRGGCVRVGRGGQMCARRRYPRPNCFCQPGRRLHASLCHGTSSKRGARCRQR